MFKNRRATHTASHAVTRASSGPAIHRILEPLAREIGQEMFSLLVADSARIAADNDYEMMSVLGGDLEDGFLAWAQGVSAAGWGKFELDDLDVDARRARVVVHDPWELGLQQRLPEHQRWGCPFLKGKLIGIFSRAFGVDCWAEEVVSTASESHSVRFDVAPSERTTSGELARFRERQMRERERDLQRQIDDKTAQLQTARRKLEGYSRNLEQRVQERTRELREQVAERAKAERLKDDLITTASHELRTPLTSLRGFAELLMERDFPADRQRRYLGIICRESNRLTDLINDFLDLQRIESGQDLYAFERLDIVPLLRTSAELFTCDGHRVVLDLPDRLPPVDADPDRIEQVLANLLSNAVKFSPGQDRVDLGARCEGGELLIRVRDYGIGIPPEVLPNLFTKFYRGVHDSVTRSIGGTGLGLALVKNLVEAHGGRAWAESGPEPGSTFHVALPLSPRAPPPSAARGAPTATNADARRTER